MITRNNYEEYFLLLADNELSQAEETLVKQFAAQHPDLQEELQLLLDCRLDIPVNLPAFNKQLLLRPTTWNIENPEPLHTQMLLLIDNELPQYEKQQLEAQIADSTALQAEWNTLQKVKLPAEKVIYPNKEDLHKQHKIRPLLWVLRVAAAAVIAFAIILWPKQKVTSTLTAGIISPFLNTQTTAVLQPANNPQTNSKNELINQQPVNNIASVTMPVKKQPATNSAQLSLQNEKTIAALNKEKKEFVKKKEKAIFKEDAVTPYPEEVAVNNDAELLTLGNNNSFTASLLQKDNITIQTARLSPKNISLASEPLQQTIAANTDATDSDEGFVHIAGARIDKHKMRNLFRGLTRTVTRTFSKSKMQPAETSYAPATRSL